MRKQRGLTLSGLMLWGILIVVLVMLGLKVGPAYMEYYTIQKTFKTIVSEPGMRNAQRSEIERAFASRAAIDNIHSVAPTDIEVSKDGGNLVLSASYSARIPLFGNASACLDFTPSSADQ